MLKNIGKFFVTHFDFKFYKTAWIAMFMGAIAEKTTHNNFIFEEGFELLFYVSIAGIVWLYSRNENFILQKNDWTFD